MQHDVEIPGVHQLADDGVDASQQLGRADAVDGQIGDVVKRLLQAAGAAQAHHLVAQVRRSESGQPFPRAIPCGIGIGGYGRSDRIHGKVRV